MSRSRKTKRMVHVADVLAIVERWRDHYPEHIFPRDSREPDSKAAFMARHVLDGLAFDIRKLGK